ncbi:MAG: NADH-quinone oxidoreductase subunit J [Anaerolineales bacterium]|nr:NADH-quinone oxidoreductase subunit J [Anaerolineales bacterium]
MEPIQIVFLIGAALVLGSAVMVVTRRNLIHAALFLILTLSGVAMIFVLLEAFYWAVIQVVVYIGAIAILIIMAIMVTRNVTGDTVKPFNNMAVWAAMLSVVASGSLIWALSYWPAFDQTAPVADTGEYVIRLLGLELFSAEGYLIPTMIASVLLLAALIAAIKSAFPISQEEE